MVTYFEPFHIIIEEPGLDPGVLVTYFCFLTPTFLLKNQVVWTKSYYDTKWFKICYQDYKLVVCCILDGFMLCKRHLTIRFCQNWKKLEKSNLFRKNLLRAYIHFLLTLSLTHCYYSRKKLTRWWQCQSSRWMIHCELNYAN